MFIPILSMLLGTLILIWVIVPLLKNMNANVKKPQTEEEYVHWLLLRDEIVLFLKEGKCSRSDINNLPPEKAFKLLVRACYVIKKFGLPHLPKILLVALLLISNTNLGLGNPDIKVPSLVETEKDIFMTQMHEYLLAPAEGFIIVRYFGVFDFDSQKSNAKSIKLALALPDNAYDLKVLVPAQVSVLPGNAGIPILDVPVKAGSNEVQAEFRFPAKRGDAVFASSNPKNIIPGLLIVVMQEHNGFLRNMFEKVSPRANIWPARIKDFPAEFKLMRKDDTAQTDSFLYGTVISPPKTDLTRLVRFGSLEAQFPSITITGVVFSRVWIYVWAAIASLILIGLLLRKLKHET